MSRLQQADLKRLARVKGPQSSTAPTLGEDMVRFFKHSVQKPQKKFGAISDCWATFIPENLLEHTALESFSKGTLLVVVDTSSHLYQLRTLLLNGLQQQLLVACKGAGLRKITLKHGRWYQGDGADRRIQFH